MRESYVLHIYKNCFSKTLCLQFKCTIFRPGISLDHITKDWNHLTKIIHTFNSQCEVLVDGLIIIHSVSVYSLTGMTVYHEYYVHSSLHPFDTTSDIPVISCPSRYFS